MRSNVTGDGRKGNFAQSAKPLPLRANWRSGLVCRLFELRTKFLTLSGEAIKASPFLCLFSGGWKRGEGKR